MERSDSYSNMLDNILFLIVILLHVSSSVKAINIKKNFSVSNLNLNEFVKL